MREDLWQLCLLDLIDVAENIVQCQSQLLCFISCLTSLRNFFHSQVFDSSASEKSRGPRICPYWLRCMSLPLPSWSGTCWTFPNKHWGNLWLPMHYASKPLSEAIDCCVCIKIILGWSKTTRECLSESSRLSNSSLQTSSSAPAAVFFHIIIIKLCHYNKRIWKTHFFKP